MNFFMLTLSGITLLPPDDLYRSLWTAVKRLYFWIWFIKQTLRVLSGQPTPCQALVMITKTTEYMDVQIVGGTFSFRTSASKIKVVPPLLLPRPQAPPCCVLTLRLGKQVASFLDWAGLTTTHIGACRAALHQPSRRGYAGLEAM